MVTIGIPVYNCPKELITNCLISVLNQTYTDIEVLIINDCCTDCTMEYVYSLIQNHHYKEKVRIINHEKNTGIAGARNTILKEAIGKYLFLMDCDDYIPNNTIEMMFNKAEEYQAEAVCGSIAIHNIDNDEIIKRFQYPNMSFFEKGSFSSYAFGDSKKNFPNSVWNIMYDLDFLRQKKLCFELYGYCDDYIFIHKLFAQLTRVILLPFITYYWVVREGSQSHHSEGTTISRKYLTDQINANNLLKEFCKSLKNKSFYGGYCLRLYKECFFTAYTMVKYKHRFDIPYSDSDIKQAISPIESLLSTIQIKNHKTGNLFFYFLGHMPSFILPFILSLLYKYRKL